MSLSILSDLLIVGISVGVLYGLLALSVSMIYASLDIIHFAQGELYTICLLYTSPSPRDRQKSRMPSSA